MENSQKGVLRFILMFIPAFIFAFPLFFLLKTSLGRHGLGNYWHALTKVHLELNLRNSFIVTLLTVLTVLAVALPAAFAFSKLKFHFKNLLYLFILMAMMVPGISIAVPVTQIIKGLGLMNNYFSLVLVYAALSGPFALVLVKGYMDQLPVQLLEASIIDGCTSFQAFRHIYLPMSKPIIAIISVFASLQSWNEFLFAMLFMKKSAMQMVTTIPIMFQADFVTDIPGLFAALVIIQLPVLILYLLFQNVFKAGLTAGAVKG